MPALKKYPGELCFVLGKASILRYRPSSVETTKGEEMRMGSHTSCKTTTLVSGGGRVDLLPHAMGLDAFWHGRPIWANPFAGEPERSGRPVGTAASRNYSGDAATRRCRPLTARPNGSSWSRPIGIRPVTLADVSRPPRPGAVHPPCAGGHSRACRAECANFR